MSEGVRITHRLIAVPWNVAYAFASEPRSFALWASGLATALHERDGQWIIDTPRGSGTVRFTPRNPHGVLDHWVRLPGEAEIYIPLRMVPAGAGTLVELVLLRQPAMSDADFAQDAATVAADLATLKRVLEARSGG